MGESSIPLWLSRRNWPHVYKSRAHRDKLMAKVMKDLRLASMMNPKSMPFDGKRMIWGGFKTQV